MMVDSQTNVTSPTDEEIAHSVAAFIGDLGKRGEDHDDKTRIVFSVAVNSVMIFITTIKLLTGDSTGACRKNAIGLIDEQIAQLDAQGDRIITWQEDGEASA